RPDETGDPLAALADAYGRVWLNTGLEHRERVIRGIAASLAADGVVFHSNRSCKPYSFGQDEIAARLKANGIPCIVMEADMADERDFAEARWRTRLDAFLERIEADHGRER
ncbi:MAG TPA: 2-hydroxyacyl-CoA dehydratase family protein, partial [Candidatus Deferrimicrobiaceae bacterium]